MKKILCISVLTALMAVVTQGAPILWGPATDVDSPTDVINSGTLIEAFKAGGATSARDQTVNGVLFAGTTSFQPLDLDRKNMAIGKPSDQSRIGAGGPDRANDGNTDGDSNNGSVSQTKKGYQPWWEVDLEAIREIGNIDVWGRTDDRTWLLKDVYVLVSVDPFESTDLATTLDQPGVTAVYIPGKIDVMASVEFGVPGRYVRVQLNRTATLLMLAEVEVWSPAFGVFSGDTGADPVSLQVGGGKLTVGSEYTIQMWYVDTRNQPQAPISDGEGSPSESFLNRSGQFATGTFVADGSTQTITLESAGLNNAYITAYQIRDRVTAEKMMVQHAFDGDSSTKWVDDSPSGSRVQYRFDRPRIVEASSLTSAQDFPDRDPTDWYVQGSHDGMSWTALDFRRGEIWERRRSTKKFQMPNTIAYQYYSINIGSVRDSQHATAVQIGEIKFHD